MYYPKATTLVCTSNPGSSKILEFWDREKAFLADFASFSKKGEKWPKDRGGSKFGNFFKVGQIEPAPPWMDSQGTFMKCPSDLSKFGAWNQILGF